MEKDEMGFIKGLPTLMENFFSGLFYTAFSITDYGVYNGMMIN
jgi:hypothetical protein